MKEKRILGAREEVPLLTQEQIKILAFEFESKRQKKYRVWTKIYLVTAVAVIAVIAALLFVGIKLDAKLFSQDYFDGLTELFLGNGFLNSWNDTPSDSTSSSTEQNSGDTPAGVIRPDLPEGEGNTPDEPKNELTSLYEFDYSKVPEGHIPIVPMDLSLYTNGDRYINNATGYAPDVEALLDLKLGSGGVQYLSSTSAPTVLIVHTHGTEAYSASGAISYPGDAREIARSEDIKENVVSVGALMARVLNEKGINTLHCTVMHDSVQYKDSYARAEQTIRQYMEKYPSIKLVIDLHRDSIVKSSGELVRPVTRVGDKTAAQVMCVVGSDWGGGECPRWQNNLSLALKLRQILNGEYLNLCRPTNLRAQSFNQELAPYSLLIEIGSSGNSLEEAALSAILTADALAQLIPQL